MHAYICTHIGVYTFIYTYNICVQERMLIGIIYTYIYMHMWRYRRLWHICIGSASLQFHILICGLHVCISHLVCMYACKHFIYACMHFLYVMIAFLCRHMYSMYTHVYVRVCMFSMDICILCICIHTYARCMYMYPIYIYLKCGL